MAWLTERLRLGAAATESFSDVAIVLGVSWLVRIAFDIAIGDAHSLDVDSWQRALDAEHDGVNPYETGVLNWPPFWLQIITLVNAVAGYIDSSFWTALRVYLMLAESALIVTLYFSLVSVGADRNAVRRALLVGIALNPVAILLICVHGNSDINVGLLVTLAVTALIAYSRARDIVLWLGGCLLLGLGVLAKTVPLVLAPLLAPGARVAGSAGRVLAAALLLGPAALGVSVIAALAPDATKENVIGYRAFPGYFGVHGLLLDVTTVATWVGPLLILALVLAGALVLRVTRRPHDGLSAARVFLLGTFVYVAAVLGLAVVFDHVSTVDVRGHYGTLFTLLVVAMVVGLIWHFWWEPPLSPEALFLFVAVAFMLVVAFGPGYGPQYSYWFLPALVATYVLLDEAWRRLLRVAYLVAGLTYIFEYGFIPWLGAWVPAVFGSSDWTTNVADFLIPYRLVLVNLPLFAVYLFVLSEGIRRLASLRTDS